MEQDLEVSVDIAESVDGSELLDVVRICEDSTPFLLGEMRELSMRPMQMITRVSLVNNSPGGCVLVARHEGQIIGYLFGLSGPLAGMRHVCRVNGLGVLPEYRRMGVAKAIMTRFVELGRERGLRRLDLKVMAGNRAARRLYLELGFEEEGFQRDVYRVNDVFVDAIPMALILE